MIKEVMPDGSIYWMIRVTFGPIVGGPRYYGPFDCAEDAHQFYAHIENGVLDLVVEFMNHYGDFPDRGIFKYKHMTEGPYVSASEGQT